MRSSSEINNPGSKVILRVNLDTEYDGERSRFQTHIKHKTHSETIDNLHSRGLKLVILTSSTPPDPSIMEKHEEVLSQYVNPDVTYIRNIKVEEAINNKDEDEIILYNSASKIDKNGDSEDIPSDFVNNFASNFDAYVNNAFSTLDMNVPSVTDIPCFIPGYAGSLLESQYTLIKSAVDETNKYTFIVGGSQIDKNLSMMRRIADSEINSEFLVTDRMASLFLEAQRYDLGSTTRASLIKYGSEDSIDRTREFMNEYIDQIHIPEDIVTDSGTKSELALSATPVVNSEVIGVGTDTVDKYKDIIGDSETAISWGLVQDNEEIQREIYEAISDVDRGIITGENTMKFCDKSGLKSFYTSTFRVDPIIEHMLEGSLPGQQVLLPSD